MRIVIDMQGAQTDSRFRGIGRYTMGITEALIRNAAKDDEVLLLLNGRLGEGIDAIRKAFKDLLPHRAFKVWYPPGSSSLAWLAENGSHQRELAAPIWSKFIESLQPDVFLGTSLFESPVQSFLVTPSKISKDIVTGAIIYDFIPLHEPEYYLAGELPRRWYSNCLNELNQTDVLFCISDFVAKETKQRFPNADAFSISTDTSGVFRPLTDAEQKEQVSFSPVTGEFDGRPFVLYTGGTDKRKNLNALLKAFGALSPELRKKHQLVIVCGNHPETCCSIRTMAKCAKIPSDNLVLMGYISDETMRHLYAKCHLFVFPSLDEGFGLPVLEALRCGAPVIASNTSSIPEVMGLDDALFSPTDVSSLTAKMTQVLTDEDFRNRLINHAARQQTKFSWDASAQKILETFRQKTALTKTANQSATHTSEVSPQTHSQKLFNLCKTLASLCRGDCIQTAEAITRTFEDSTARPQLFVDISILRFSDSGTGIQRVTRSILSYLLTHPPKGYVVRPVYTTPDKVGYRYAHRFLLDKLNFDDGQEDDYAVDFTRNDLFFGLDLNFGMIPHQQAALKLMHRHGVRIWFMVYDLLPVRFPDYFPDGQEKPFANWLSIISQFDGLMCISKVVADDMRQWIQENVPERLNDVDIRWFHLGSNLKDSIPSQGLPGDAQTTLNTMAVRPTFLMVSTVEPRKGYVQALAAFERLWKKGVDVNLCIIGREGWKMEALTKRLRTHAEAGWRLFWLEGVSDEYLEKAYEVASAVIMASTAEGFGLAIVEGAQHHKPLILRDLPVFREIAHDSAFYFKGTTAADLANAIEEWLQLNARGLAPTSEGVECISWEESAQMLLDRLPL